MKRTFFQSIGAVGILAMIGAGVFFWQPASSVANTNSYTVSGNAFSDMPNASDQIKTTNNPYGGRGVGNIDMDGVTVDPVTGNFSGNAYNALIGHATMTPAGQNGVTVSPSCLNDKTKECPVSGFFQFTSSADPQSGGWDGLVKMSDPSWQPTVKLSKEDSGGVRTMSGFAWGGDVVGWVYFNEVQIYPSESPYGCTDSTALNYDATAKNNDGSCCYAPNTWNATTKQCVPSTLCPTPAPNPNYPGFLGYNDQCPCVGAPGNQCGTSECPAINYPGISGYNKDCPCTGTASQCSTTNDLCRTTKIENSNVQNFGKDDPNTIGIQNQTNWPIGYTVSGNRCGIPGCNISYAKNYNQPSNWTIAVNTTCEFCPAGEKLVGGKCEKCTDPSDKTECPVPPSSIRPTVDEV